MRHCRGATLLVPSRMDRHSYAWARVYDKTQQGSHTAGALQDGQALVRLRVPHQGCVMLNNRGALLFLGRIMVGA